MNYDNMPRAELIADLEAWKNKFDHDVKQQRLKRDIEVEMLGILKKLDKRTVLLNGYDKKSCVFSVFMDFGCGHLSNRQDTYKLTPPAREILKVMIKVLEEKQNEQN